MSAAIIRARSFSSMLQLHCADQSIANEFAYIAAEPEMSEPCQRIIDVETVKLHEGFYDFSPPFDGKPGVKAHMVNRSHQILRDLMIEEVAGCPILHGASIVCNGRRALIIATKAAGKTTFSLKCVAESLNVEGDEHVLIREHDVLARPRTLRIKEGSLTHLPELADRIRKCPFICDWHGGHIYSMAPEMPDQPWQINAGPADFLMFLTPNHGGLTSIKRMQADEAFDRVLKQAFLPGANKPAALARLHTFVRAKDCWELCLGSLDDAVWHLRQLCST